VASLSIGPEHITVSGPGELVSLPVGSSSIVRHYFKRWPPTALQMEHAIAAIEDALADARGKLAPALLHLETTHASVRDFARRAGASDSLPLTVGRDAIEQVFNWLVDVAEGAPGQAPDAAPLEWAATLVILREMMHHWGLESITVREAAA
jgi:exopolyphosphatase/pppGpp-phosphohydrolase